MEAYYTDEWALYDGFADDNTCHETVNAEHQRTAACVQMANQQSQQHSTHL